MKALVTGGAGFLGHYIVDELEKQKIKTIILDSAAQNIAEDNGWDRKNVEYIQTDILDCPTISDAMKGCSLVFHTAAIADINITRDIPVRTMEVNVVGTAKCLECARDNNVDRFMFASSVYASSRRGNFYRVSKQAGEELCKTYADEFSLDYTVCRYGSLYGREANHWNFMYGVIKSLLLTGEYVFTSSPDAMREYIHIHDAARETVKIAQDPEYRNKTILLTGHQRMKMQDLFDIITEIMGGNVKIRYNPEKNNPHYIRTPYAFERDVPARINLSHYIDINEGILDCMNEVKKEIKKSY